MKTWAKYRWIGIICLSIAFFAVYSSFSVANANADTKTLSVKVTCSTLNVRSGPSTSYASLGKLTLGTRITVTRTTIKNGKTWYQFTYRSSKGYVLSTYTKKLSSTLSYSPLRTGKTLYAVNVRATPSTSGTKLGTLSKGTTITLRALYRKATTSTNYLWYRITYKGKTAYVTASYVKMLPTVTTYNPVKNALSTKATSYRSGPGTSYSSYGTANINTQIAVSALVTTYGSSSYNKWYKTTYNGKTAYVYAGYFKWLPDGDAAAFEAYMTAQGFPDSYKAALRTLHASHPKWIFTAQQTGIKWSSALALEQKVGVSLLSASTPEAWKSFESGAYDFTNNAYVKFDTSWNAADGKVVAYYFDPRNFLAESSIYQFLDQKFDAASQNISTVRAVANDAFFDTDGYAKIILNAAQSADVNANLIAAIIRQEQGVKGTSSLISGTCTAYNNAYYGIYNYFNIGAYTSGGMTAVERGLWYAKGSGTGDTTYGRPWTTKTKSITGGAMYYRKGYIANNQNTLYLKKFNVMNGLSKVATHQYMTHILAAANEASSMGLGYAANDDYPLVFCIPVYTSMPSTPCTKPGITGNNDNVLNSLCVRKETSSGAQYTLVRSTGSTGFTRYTTGYSITVPTAVTKIYISGVAHNTAATVTGNGVVTLASGTNTIKVVVKSTSGQKRTYTITVNRS